MTLDIAIDADAEWDSSNGAVVVNWANLARSAATAAIAESAFPQLAEGDRTIELSVCLTSDEQVHALNSEWRGKDNPTNVLSFPMADEEDLADATASGPELMLGDIILAHGVCEAEASAKGVSLDQHATHLMIHGTLHLLGYDHMDDDSAADMEAREVRALARLGIADPYAEAC